DTQAMLDVSVSIKTISQVRRDRVGDSVWAPGSGSGFLVSAARCEVWTNFHVVRDAALIEVRPRGWEASAGIPATFVHGSPRSDVAVLRMERCEGIAEARFGDAGQLRPGDETYAVGNPLGQNPDTITRGIISHTERYSASGTTPYLQTDAAINPGSSGGALFDRGGSVIGINTAIAATRGGGNVGIGYAIPINVAFDVVSELANGVRSFGYAGFEDSLTWLAPDEAELFEVPRGLAGLVVAEPPTARPALGVLKARDVIYRIAGRAVASADEVRRQIGAMDAGATVALDIVREGQRLTLALQLTEGGERQREPQAEYFDGLLGMNVEMWSQHDDERGQFDRPVITRVHSLGPAHRAQIASSQKNVTNYGPYVLAYLMDVKTITGVVRGGVYTPVANLTQLNAVVESAYRDSSPLLLEVETWRRHDPRDPGTALGRVRRSFFRIQPALSLADQPLWRPDHDTLAEDAPGESHEIVAARWVPRKMVRVGGPSA
ncbi:MAG: trypsin-like peptidase domain-containing protein, partial [Pseudomonadota bacterium]